MGSGPRGGAGGGLGRGVGAVGEQRRALKMRWKEQGLEPPGEGVSPAPPKLSPAGHRSGRRWGVHLRAEGPVSCKVLPHQRPHVTSETTV